MLGELSTPTRETYGDKLTACHFDIEHGMWRAVHLKYYIIYIYMYINI